MSRLDYTPPVISLDLFIDSWSQTFIALIVGIGLLVAWFAFFYLHDGPSRKKFYPTFLLFAASMLGIVSFDNLLMVFVCWELTSILSFFLISFYPENPKARKGATHAALLTGAGGLCLLLAILMIHQVTGSYSLSEVLNNTQLLAQHEWAPAIAGLVLLAGMTKSALFPFSFWLPGAMTAPTPVSSYLHSATMVKAGIFLFFRMQPLFASTPLWQNSLLIFGGFTFVVGSLRSFAEDDLKRILAYTTVASLGLMSFMIGWGTESSLSAVTFFLVAHALYKCGLFQYAGVIDHQVHTRLLSQLGGLRQDLPKIFIVALILAFAGIGFIPSYAFLAKEKMLLSLDKSFWPLVMMFLGFSFMGAAILRVCLSPFIARRPEGLKAGDPGVGLLLTPFIFGCLSLLLVFLSGNTADLWHGFNLEISLSIFSVIASVSLFLWAQKILQFLPFDKIQGGQIFDDILQWHFAKALKVTHVIQSGSLRAYILSILMAAFALILWQWPHEVVADWHFDASSLKWLIVCCALVKLFSIGWVLKTSRPLEAVLGLGLIGYIIAILFALYGAPDLAMTQFAVETLSVFLFVLVLKDIPRLKESSSRRQLSVDVVISLFAGFLMFSLTWLAVQSRVPSRLRDFFAEHSLVDAHGRNVVNVILVDFRGFDTFGEISVLGLAALGIVAMLQIHKRKGS